MADPAAYRRAALIDPERMPKTDDRLLSLIAQARARVEAMTPVERVAMIDAQRRSFVLAEASFGSDADEAAYAAALRSGDAAAIAREKAKAQERVDVAARYLRTRPATRHVSPPGLPPQPRWGPKRTGVRAALARLLDVLMGRPG